MKTRNLILNILAVIVLLAGFNRASAQSLSVSAGTSICLGSESTLIASGGTGYSWTPATGLSCTSCATTTASPAVTTTYTVSATVLGVPTSATVTITVNAVPSAIMGESAICAGTTTMLTNAFTDGTWTSSNTAVATINEWGEMTGIASGTTTITYQLPNTCLATTDITVGAPAAIDGIAAIFPGTTATLTCMPEDGTWSASNGNVTIDPSGELAAVSGGTATISYVSPTGCVSTGVMTVNGSPAAITGTAFICAGGTTTFSSASAGGTWSSSNTSVATVDASSGDISGVAAGSATITYSIGAAFTTKQVFINALPDEITGITTFCAGTNTVLYSTIGGSGTWSSSDPSIATINTTSGMATGISAGTATITCLIASSGCYKTKDITVNPTPDAIDGETGICVGEVSNFSNSVAGGTWSSSNSSVATVGTAGTVNTLTAGGTTISYTMATGCYKTLYVTVKAIPAPISGSSVVCESATCALSDATTGGTWSSSDIGVFTIDETSGSVTGQTAGTATAFYTGSNGCYRQKTITVNTQPTAPTGTDVICLGSTATWTNATAGGTWTSSNTATATINATTGMITAVGTGTTMITYSVSGAGCKATRELTIDNTPATITGTTTFCAGSTTTLSHPVSGGNWSSANAAVATVNSSTGVVSGIAAGNTTITYRVSEGCFVTTSITVKALPATIAGTATLCVGSSTALSSSPAGGTWYSSSSNATINASTGAIIGTTSGTATISYVSAGCARTTTVTVNTALPAIAGNASVCPATTTTLSNTTTGGTWTSSNTAKATINSTTGLLTGVANGTTIITYATSATCYTAKQVTVSSTIASITGTTSVCVGSTITLSHSIDGGNWSSSATSKATVGATGIVTGISAGWATITYATGGSCFAVKTIAVNALPAPVSGNLTVCEGAYTVLTATVGGNGTWCSSNSAIASANSTSGMVTGIAAGTASVSYKIPATGCFTSAIVTVNQAPAAITGSSTLCTGTSATLTNAITGGTWTSSAPTVASINTTNGDVSALTAGGTTITYKLANGCTKKLTLTVKASPAAITGTATVNVGSTVTLANATVGGTWSSSSTGNATIGSSTGVVTGVSAGNATITYRITTTGCFATRTVTVNSVAGRSADNQPMVQTEFSFSFYPNPTTGNITVAAGTKGSLYLFSQDARVVGEYNIDQPSVQISLPGNLAAGVYYCRFVGEDGSSAAAQLVYNP
ncbi:MAG: Ig-like domain-containing protein [Flavipsychrobacter sp.]|nr:Ig-like domain-containing protein [Flavipsychrobacter sp.]